MKSAYVFGVLIVLIVGIGLGSALSSNGVGLLAQPTATPIPPTPTVVPTATPIPTVTPTPVPLQKVNFTGRFDPPALYVGDKLVITFSLTNESDKPIKGFEITTQGPWNHYTIANVLAGNYQSELFGGIVFTSNVEIPPGQTRGLTVVAYPNQSGNDEFYFFPHQLNGDDLVDDQGQSWQIGGKVAVIQ